MTALKCPKCDNDLVYSGNMLYYCKYCKKCFRVSIIKSSLVEVVDELNMEK